MSESQKQELSNRRASLMMQYQEAQLEGRQDDAQFLLTEVDKIDKQMRGSSGANGNPLKALVLLVPPLVRVLLRPLSSP